MCIVTNYTIKKNVSSIADEINAINIKPLENNDFNKHAKIILAIICSGCALCCCVDIPVAFMFWIALKKKN